MIRTYHARDHEIRAFLDGSKTALSVPLKPQPDARSVRPLGFVGSPTKFAFTLCHDGGANSTLYVPLPFSPGDLIVVKEAWAESTAVRSRGRHGPPDIYYKADRRADFPSPSGHVTSAQIINAHLDSLSWRSPAVMPRWASRITLRVTDVRVCRVQDTTEDEAWTEGWPDEPGGLWPVDWFRDAWTARHGPGSWGRNPWIARSVVSAHLCNVKEMKS